jgi:hypothetical protein
VSNWIDRRAALCTAHTMQASPGLLWIVAKVLRDSEWLLLSSAGRMGRPHIRTIFLDPGTDQLNWCGKNDGTQSGGGTAGRGTSRAGVMMANLREVRSMSLDRQCGPR